MAFRHSALLLVLVFAFMYGCNEVENTADDAVGAKDPSKCKTLKDKDDVRECYGIVAEKMDDPEVCSEAPDKNDCIGYYASSKGSIKYCDMTSDEVAKYGCVARVTGDQTGRAIDQIISDWRGKGTIENCKKLCTGEEESCGNACSGAGDAAKDNCLNSYIPSSDSYFVCADAAAKASEDCRLDCYRTRLECVKACGQ
jgi:hypothetical protein